MRTWATYFSTGILAINTIFGLLAIAASPIHYTPIFLACIIASLVIWIAVRHRQRSYYAAGFFAIALIGIGLILIAPVSNAQTPVEHNVDVPDMVNTASDIDVDVAAADSSSWVVCTAWSNTTTNPGDEVVKVYATTDAGDSYSSLVLDTGSSGTDVCRVDYVGSEQYVVAYVDGDNLKHAVTNDTGDSWWQKDLGVTSSGVDGNLEVSAYDEGSWVIIVEDSSGDFRTLDTTDSGITYTDQDTYGAAPGSHIAFAARDGSDWSVAYKSGTTVRLVHSEDGGASWTGPVNVPADAACFGGANLNTPSLAYTGSDLFVGYTTDQGNGFVDAQRACRSTDNGATFDDASRTGTGFKLVTASDRGEMHAQSSTEYSHLLMHTDESDSFQQLMLLHVDSHPTDGTGGYQITNISARVGNEFFGLSAPTSGFWLAAYATQSDNSVVYVNVTAITTANPDASYTCNGCSDVRTTYDNTPLIFTREETTSRITRLDADLVVQESALVCSQGADPLTGLRSGLTVPVDQKVVYPCLGVQSPIVRTASTQLGLQTTVEVNVIPEAMESFTGNVILVYDPGDNDQNFVVVDGVTANQDATLTLAGINDADIEKFGSNITYVTGDFGTQARTGVSQQLSFRNDGLVRLCVAAHNGTVWLGDADKIERYNTTAGTFNLENSISSVGCKAGGMRVSKDGAYLFAWQNEQVVLMNSTSLTVLRTEPIGTTVNGADMDFLNNYLYVATDDNVFRFNVFDVTGSVAGDGNPGEPNPAPTNNPFADFESTEDDPGIIDGGGGGGVPAGATGSTSGDSIFSVVSGADSLGVAQSTMRAFIAVLLIAGMAGGAYTVFENVPLSAGAGGLGFFLAIMFGFIPLWFVFLVSLLVIGFIVWRLQVTT